jgi:hypothetical protein
MGVILELGVRGKWTVWMQFFGAGVLTAYFLPALLVTLVREPSLIRMEPGRVLIAAIAACIPVACVVINGKRVFCSSK